MFTVKKLLLTCNVCGVEHAYVSTEDEPGTPDSFCRNGHSNWTVSPGTWDWPEPDHSHPQRSDGSLDWSVVQ